MGGSTGTKSRALPSWQIPQAFANTEGRSDRLSDGSATLPRASLLGQASKFLKDREVRAATGEQKSNFLRAKGLTDEEINELLGKEDRAVGSTEITDEESPDEATAEENVNHDNNTIDDVDNPPKVSSMDIMDDYIDSEPLPDPKEDRPPIITYPEFLLHSQRPPPMITTDRLVSAFYLASGTAAAMYGLSKYIVEPMFESLTLARHSFFENASSNIDQLNDKLGGAVSNIPNSIDNVEEKEVSDGDSLSSDPSHLFSRTIATQTSPRLSRSTSSTSLDEKVSIPITNIHADQMIRINGLLSELNRTESDVPDPIKENFRLLAEYFNDLPMLGRTGKFVKGKQTDLRPDQRLDGVANVKAEIKSVKGALLSARNFPAGNTSR